MNAAGKAPSTGPRKRGRPAASSGVETRKRIVEAAQKRFGELGLSGLSIEHLARDVGLDTRAIYHYFPSKRALFNEAAHDAFEVYATEVANCVLVHPDTRARLHGFVDVYRRLFAERRHLLSFISVVMLEAIAARYPSVDGASGDRRVEKAEELAGLGEPIVAMNLSLVEQAVAASELDRSVDTDSALLLLHTIGMGLGLASLDPQAPFLSMLDALDLLIDGTLLCGS